MTETQRNQYQQMHECLVAFRSGKLPLSDLIEQLPSLVKELDDPDPAWKDEFVSYWWTLEQVHGQAIDLGESRRMPSGSRKTVDDAIEGLQRLIESTLSTPS